jgi:hypothetical protein
VKTGPVRKRAVRSGSIAVYRAILRCYPRPFRDPWADEVVQVFAELARRQPPGPASTVALWIAQLPDLGAGFLAEWWRELRRVSRGLHTALTHGAVAGALLSMMTVAGNLGRLWATFPGAVVSWLITAVAVTVLALSGRPTAAARAGIVRASSNGFVAGLIAFTSANLTATFIVLTCLDRLSHDPVQMTAFVGSHESDFRTYQLHELLGGWTYGTAAGALLGALSSGIAAAARRHPRQPAGETAPAPADGGGPPAGSGRR